MRKYIRNQIVDMMDTVIDDIQYIRKLTINNISVRDCQSAMKAINDSCKNGLSADRYNYYNQLFKEINKDFECLTEMDVDERNKICDSIYGLLISAKNELAHEAEVKKEILFLPCKAEMWNDFESVWQEAVKDKEHCEAIVMPIPYCDRKLNGEASKWYYEGTEFPDYVSITDFSQYDIAKHRPDIIYSYNPDENYGYFSSIHSVFYSSELRKYTDKLVYVPYLCQKELGKNNIPMHRLRLTNVHHPLVSICIPTFNRCEYLRNSLNSLVNQKEFLEKKVEIVISDNASTDDTQNMMLFYLNKYDNIRYHRNDINIGGGANCKFSMVLGKGTLLKLFSDDFIYVANSLDFFCNYAEKYKNEKPQLFFSNGTYPAIFDGFKETNFEYYIYTASYLITWIGSYAIWRTDLDKYYDDNVGIEKECWQVQPTLDVLNEKDKGVIVGNHFGGRPFIKNKNINYDVFKVFYTNFLDMLRPFNASGKLSDSCMDWVERDILLNFMPEWVVRQELNVSGWSYYDKSLKAAVENKCRQKPYYDIYLEKYREIFEFCKARMPGGRSE